MAVERMDVDLDTINAKRKTSVEEPEKKKKKKTKKPVDITNKTPVQLLHEECGMCEYRFTSIGTVQLPSFKAVSEIRGETFEGIGSSKLAAKRELATTALAKLLNIVWPVEQSVKEEIPQHNFSIKPIYTFNQGPYMDFTQDDDMSGRDFPLYVTPQFRNGSPNKTHEAVQKCPTIDTEKARNYPVMVLSEAFPDVQLNWVDGSGRRDRKFKVEAEVLGRKFFGEGRSKKIAKLNLAKTVLLCMYDIHDFKEIEAVVKSPKPLSEKALFEKKFPLTQLKELIGEDNMNIEVVQVEQAEVDEKTWHATIVVKGIAYEAVGKNRNIAKIHAAKKALDVIRPKKEVQRSEGINAYGVDVNRHPSMVFYEFYRDVKFVETESKNTDGHTEFHLEAEVEGKLFKVTASSKKKAKLKLVLNIFKELKNTDPTEWTTIDQTISEA